LRKEKIDAEVISSGITKLLRAVGIDIPFASEALKIGVNTWVKSLPRPDHERYSATVEAARRSGNNLRKAVDRLAEAVEEEEKTVIWSLFVGFLLASFFEHADADDELGGT